MLGTRPIGSAPLSALGATVYDISLSDTISIADAYSVNIDYVTTVSDAISASDQLTAYLDYVLGYSDSLTLSNTYDTETIWSLTETLTLLSDLYSPGVSYQLTLSDTLTLVATDTLLNETHNLSLTDIIVLADTFDANAYTPMSDTLTLTDVYAEGLLPIDDTLVLADTYTALVDYVISTPTSLLIADETLIGGDYTDTVTDTIVFSQSFEDTYLSDDILFIETYGFVLEEMQFVSHTLTLTDTFDYIKAYDVSTNDTFLLVDFLEVDKHISFALEDELEFEDEYLNGTIFDLALCDVLNLDENLGNQYDVSLTDTIVLTEPDRDILEHTLVFVEEYVTNMDNEDCAHPGGYSAEKGVSESVTFTDVYLAKIDYRMSLSDAPTLLNTTTWRV